MAKRSLSRAGIHREIFIIQDWLAVQRAGFVEEDGVPVIGTPLCSFANYVKAVARVRRWIMERNSEEFMVAGEFVFPVSPVPEFVPPASYRYGIDYG